MLRSCSGRQFISHTDCLLVLFRVAQHEPRCSPDLTAVVVDGQVGVVLGKDWRSNNKPYEHDTALLGLYLTFFLQKQHTHQTGRLDTYGR